MNRRSYLRVLGSAGLGTLAGCLDAVPTIGEDGRTALSPPEAPRGDPIHPTHGEEFPAFSLPDPIDGDELSLSGLKGERAFCMTFVYTSCVDACGTLVRLLQLIQADALERGYGDDLALLAMTFDPETDDAEALGEYAERFEVDLDAGGFHFLRPESNDQARSLMNRRFGVPVASDDGGDVREGGGGHRGSDDGDHDHGGGHPLHYYMLFVVNDRGIVERSYPNVVDGREETRPAAIIEDVRRVVR